ncbi:hypothetical protein FQR65_LT11473 [Abscondita terminalis]|nr:hypothetical protein FQR65_LT11473 [Abscondita terminalis]
MLGALFSIVLGEAPYPVPAPLYTAPTSVYGLPNIQYSAPLPPPLPIPVPAPYPQPLAVPAPVYEAPVPVYEPPKVEIPAPFSIQISSPPPQRLVLKTPVYRPPAPVYTAPVPLPPTPIYDPPEPLLAPASVYGPLKVLLPAPRVASSYNYEVITPVQPAPIAPHLQKESINIADYRRTDKLVADCKLMDYYLPINDPKSASGREQG